MHPIILFVPVSTFNFPSQLINDMSIFLQIDYDILGTVRSTLICLSDLCRGHTHPFSFALWDVELGLVLSNYFGNCEFYLTDYVYWFSIAALTIYHKLSS